MKSKKINNLLSLVANVGVILGIVFLAYEIQQNTNMMRAQTRDSMADKQIEFLTTIGSDEYTSAVSLKGFSDPSSLQGTEAASWAFLVQALFRMWENEWYQYEQGLFAESEFEARARSWAGNLSRPRIQQVWRNNRSNYSEGFRRYIEELSPGI